MSHDAARTSVHVDANTGDLFREKKRLAQGLSQIVMMSWKKKRKEKVSYRRVMNEVLELVSFVDLIWYVHMGRLCGLCFGFLCWYTFVYGWRLS